MFVCVEWLLDLNIVCHVVFHTIVLLFSCPSPPVWAANRRFSKRGTYSAIRAFGGTAECR